MIIKNFTFRICLLLCFLVSQVYATNNKDLIEIYFVNSKPNLHYDSIERYRFKVVYKTDELYQMITDRKPFIETDDIASYDWNKHCVYLKDRSWNYIRRYMSLQRPGDYEVLFIILLNKKVLYYGFVLTGSWSVPRPIPAISPYYFYENEPYMPKKMFENQSFVITYINMEDQLDEPEQNPELYNKLNKGQRDPRQNKQLYQALLRTGKLHKQK